MPFVHLHNHSEFSMLDGIAPIKKIAGRIRELGMPAYALTDHGVMYGAIPFYKACNDAGIKPIIGCEVYVAARRLTDRDPQLDRHSFHLTLLAKNLTGYRNLMKLVSLAHCEGMFYKPRVDFESLSLHAEGLICLSGCLNGPVSHTFLNSGEEAATALVERYASVFGGDYYIELQRHGIEEEDRVREYLLDIAKRKGIRPVATNDCHYIHKEDARAHDIALCIGTKTLIENEDRLRYNSPEYYIKSREEMAGLFRGREDALQSGEIARLHGPDGKVRRGLRRLDTGGRRERQDGVVVLRPRADVALAVHVVVPIGRIAGQAAEHLRAQRQHQARHPFVTHTRGQEARKGGLLTAPPPLYITHWQLTTDP